MREESRAERPPRINRGVFARFTQFCRSWHLASLLQPTRPARPQFSLLRQERGQEAGLMASNYVDTTGEEGRFHGHHSSSTTPTGAAASPKTMRRSLSSAASASFGGGHGAAAKCVCAPATHAGSFKCRLHRSSSHGHSHHPTSPPSPATGAAPPAAVPSSSSRAFAAQ